MSPQIGARSVLAPDGVQWRVTRRWLTRRPPRWLRGRGRTDAADSLLNFGSVLPDVGGADLGQELLALAALVAVVLVVIPVLFFGFELVILGLLLAAGVMARTLLGQPWVVEATSADPHGPGRRLEWRVRGWRRSRTLIAEVAAELEAGREPSPDARISA